MRRRFSCFGALAVMSALTLGGFSGPTQAREASIFVVFRYDDYSDASSTELERKLIDAFETRGISCTFAVVPHRLGEPSLGEAKAAILRRAIRAGVVDVALHGYTHARQANGLPEFSGLDCASQLTRIAQGKKFLKEALGVPVREFVPPWNWYDRNTMDVLEKAEFTCLSAGLDGPGRSASTLIFLPETSRADEVRQAVESLRKARLSSAAVVALLHDFDFREVNAERAVTGLNEFTRMLDWVGAQEDVAVCGSVRRAMERIDDLGPQRFLANHAVYEMIHMVQPFLLDRYVGKAYLPSEAAWATRNKLIAIVSCFNLALLVLSLVVSLVASGALVRRWRSLGAALPWTILVLLAATAAYSLRDLTLGFKGLAAVAVLGGTWIGTSLSARRSSCRGRQESSPAGAGDCSSRRPQQDAKKV